MVERIPVAVLGATGSVGQRFVQLLEGHPWFELTAVTGSERRVGKEFGETCHWILQDPMPDSAKSLVVQETVPEGLDVPLVFSALPSGVAKQKEALFASAGMAVCSNAGAFRQEPDVPILLPEVNPEHAHLVDVQRRLRGWEGCITTNPNCTSTGVTIALKALQDSCGLSKVFAVSLQAISGAGYPGVASLDILDNVIPHISNEEPKFEWEPRKMLGSFEGEEIVLADFLMSTHCNRVAVSDGHLVCVSVETREPVTVKEAVQILGRYAPPEASFGLPSTPEPVILVSSDPDRPQPRLDRMTGKGMTTVVGRVREDPIFGLKFIVLSHNTIRGAAGGSIYNAELLRREGLLGI
ncbi:MAG TPA: aspartate-semialdehyde dehydrogenase [Acidobacteriota bacterium]|nr:aspartate-semialdehyde dehydrogenase [Acidobacteriota bacterium]